MPIRHALSRTLAAHRSAAILYATAAATWGGAIAAAAEDVAIDVMLLAAIAALASVVISFQHAMLTRNQQASEAARVATEALTRTVLTRPHDRDHEETGPYATVSGLRSLPGQRANLQ